MGSPDFDEALDRYAQALQAVPQGDVEPSLKLWSRRADVTLANPVGPPVRGFDEVAATAQRTVSPFRDGEAVTFERITAYATEDLGYVHWIERTRVRIGEGDELRSIALRVTLVLRREEGHWRIIHRHADPNTGPRSTRSIAADS